MKMTKNDVKRIGARVVVRVGYCGAEYLTRAGEACGAAQKLGSASGVYGWNWDSFRFINSDGGAVVIVTGYRDLMGELYPDIVKKYNALAETGFNDFSTRLNKKSERFAEICREFADEITRAAR